VNLWVVQSLNSLALGGVLFILAAGFSLIFGLMRIANLSHGAYFMLGAYIGLGLLERGASFLVAMLAAGAAVGLLGAVVERLVLRRLAGNALAQVLATLGIAFVIADFCLWFWGGDPRPVSAPAALSGAVRVFGMAFPLYRIAVLFFAIGIAIALWLLLEKTRIGVMIRASVDDMQMARGVGIPAAWLFVIVFSLGTALAGIGGVVAAPILSLVVVILGGLGSLFGAFVGSFIVGFIYTFGQVLLPDLAYIILFLPMVVILAVRPRGLFGRISA
jgi:branched-chain amino acid transport system permease protein